MSFKETLTHKVFAALARAQMAANPKGCRIYDGWVPAHRLEREDFRFDAAVNQLKKRGIAVKTMTKEHRTYYALVTPVDDVHYEALRPTVQKEMFTQEDMFGGKN